MTAVAALVLAAGKGTRMKSKLPKVLHKVGGKAMVERVIDTAKAVGVNRNVVIIGFGGDEVREYLDDTVEFVVQKEQKGTGHAVQQAQPVLGDFDGTILLLSGDTPLITEETITQLLAQHHDSGAAATVLTAEMPDPFGYGRIIRNKEGNVMRIVEQKDGNLQELAVREVNTGMYAFNSADLWPCLAQLDDNNAQGELYITDVISILVNQGKAVGAYMAKDYQESLGVNSRVQLSVAESILRERTLTRLMESGVTIINPATTYVETTVTVGPDTVLYPGTMLEGNTVIGSNCAIGPDTRLQDAVVGDNVTMHYTYGHEITVDSGANIGPFVHLRPGTHLHANVKVGNFVEVKNSDVGEGTKFPHLSYIGDSDVGADVNIGCGTITVNYDGKLKHRTTIEAGAFIGCNSNLVAPVTIGKEAFVGAGSTITKDVPERALAVGRPKQIVKEHWVTDDTFKKK